MNIKKKISDYMTQNSNTFLGIGPMSVNCVDAAIELAKENDFLLMFIASRRQIDSKAMGGGYVNNWTTEQFSKYVLDRKDDVILARDHGGPWQNMKEITENFNKNKAIESAKKSFETDILNNFQVLHIDPSIPDVERLSQQDILQICFELMDHCWSFAQKNGKNICFEIGTEEQSGLITTIEEFENQIIEIKRFCLKNKIEEPLFVVAQTGTRVIETRNIGTFNHPIRVKDEMPPEIQIPKILEVCNRNNIFLKQHNTDYLEEKTLSFCPIIGIHAANVAPEFGVVETKGLLKIAHYTDVKIKDKMIEIIYASKKWQKWMIKNTNASVEDKANIAGHYLFSNPEFVNLKKELAIKVGKTGSNLDNLLKEEIKFVIKKYLRCFRMI